MLHLAELVRMRLPGVAEVDREIGIKELCFATEFDRRLLHQLSFGWDA